MQFVQSVPVAEVLATEGNIQVRATRRSLNESYKLLSSYCDRISINTPPAPNHVSSQKSNALKLRRVLLELLQEARAERKGAVRHQLGSDGHLREELR